jgi:hypothetical protein
MQLKSKKENNFNVRTDENKNENSISNPTSRRKDSDLSIGDDDSNKKIIPTL